MRRTWLITCSLSLALGGCLDAGAAGTADPDTPSNPDTPSDPDPTAPDPTDPDPTDPDPTDPDPTDPGDPIVSLPWCLPAARPHDPNLNLPEVPAEALDLACGLTEEITTTHNGERRTVYTWVDENTLAARYPNGGYANLLKLTFVDGARVEARYGQAAGGASSTQFNPFEDIDRFRWDTDGNLIELARVEPGVGQDDVYLTQTWEGGRLATRHQSRTTWVDGVRAKQKLATVWTYDDEGRLTLVKADGYGHHWEIRWSYDAAGRPTRVERDRDGERVEELSWTFDDDNRLATRTTFVDRTLTNEDGFDPASVDTLGTEPLVEWLGNPFDPSLPTDLGGCRTLPNTVHHGYPSGEREYDLGMPREERPNGIGWAYGNDSYGWNYGDLAWYSHAGIAGFDASTFWWQTASATLTYTDGRMAHESVSSDGESPFGWERTRTFDAAGNLVNDRLEMTATVAQGSDQPEALELGRDLAFTWSGGDLLARELVDDVAGVMERQTWTWDAAGRWASHEVSEPDYATRIYAWRATEPLCEGEACPSPDTMWRRYEREVDAAGRTTLMRSIDLTSDLPPEEQRMAYDAAGRLVERQSSYGTVERWEYDAQGNLVLSSWDYDDDGEPEGWQETSWDSDGRWTARRSYNDGVETQSTVRAFSCE